MLTCKDVSVLLSQAEDREIGAAERLRLEAHLRLCEACRHVQKQMAFLRHAVRRHPLLRERDAGEEE
jgi:predicted anti-sigma-YlaC factor YlaD